ncbi:hypothetical protein M1K48_05730 [Sphingomonas glaciei]|uniref:Uncharacterized protein n=2 Tax=Sphingomonas glaciei TaxID=2938948 RepID=A0ABY5N118_9SPHN|nr:hypothetical protein M1K48_05730 [Sphingomonas glaciei]
MTNLSLIALTGTLVLTGLLVAGMFASRAWFGWLEVRKLELASGRPQADEPVAAAGASGTDRIELADLKARIRKLEAIASGIDL